MPGGPTPEATFAVRTRKHAGGEGQEQDREQSKVASGLIRSPRSRSLNRAHLGKCKIEWILATGIDFAFCGCVVRVLFPVARLFCPRAARTETVSDWGGGRARPLHRADY